MEQPFNALEDQEKFLKNICDNLPQMVNGEKRMPLAKQYNIRPDQYRIVLHLSAIRNEPRVLVAIQPGPVVQIHLKWPETASNILKVMKRQFDYITKFKLIEPMAIERYMVVEERRENYRKFVKHEFGDEAEILPDLLPRKRISVSHRTEHIATVRDNRTGLKVEKRGENSWDLERQAWYELSRLVTEHEKREGTHANPTHECSHDNLSNHVVRGNSREQSEYSAESGSNNRNPPQSRDVLQRIGMAGTAIQKYNQQLDTQWEMMVGWMEEVRKETIVLE